MKKRNRRRKGAGRFLCGSLRFFVTSVLRFSEFNAENMEKCRRER